jgi:hypothetical protein
MSQSHKAPLGLASSYYVIMDPKKNPRLYQLSAAKFQRQVSKLPPKPTPAFPLASPSPSTSGHGRHAGFPGPAYGLLEAKAGKPDKRSGGGQEEEIFGIGLD